MFSKRFMKKTGRSFSNASLRRVGGALVIAVLLFGQFALLCPITHGKSSQPFQQASRREIQLPTPRSHYDKFQPGTSGVPLLVDLLKDFDPTIQKVFVSFARSAGLQNLSQSEIDAAGVEVKELLQLAELHGITQESLLPKQQALAALRKANWSPYRPQLLEFFIHQSKVLEMIPPKWGPLWYPIVHDSFLYFLDHLSDERLLEKLVDLAYLPPGTSRGNYLITFVSKVPSLQKMGQILARNPDLSPDYRAALQDLENGIHTMTRDELVDFVIKEVGKESIDKHQVQFADQILAEASVGAVIRASLVLPGSPERREAIVKIIKPYVLVNLPEDLDILEGLAVFFTREHDFYELGSIPLVQIFREIKNSLTREIRITDEQHNLVRAREYYKGNSRVLIAELFPLSNQHVTFMQFVKGEKITASFPNQPAQRAVMAQRLNDVMTFDVIFAPKPEAIFHGDPHAGNVYHVLGDKDPYRIALLDWGLFGTFPRQDRVGLMQLLLGVQLGDAKRLRKYAGSLLEQGMPTAPDKLQRIDAIIAEIIVPKAGRGSFEALQEFMLALIHEGYAPKFNLDLFIKSQLTIDGILAELDPNLQQDKYLEDRIASQVKSELPKRLLNTIYFPGWNSRGYRSLLSNSDVMAARKGKKTKKAKPAPTAAVTARQGA